MKRGYNNFINVPFNKTQAKLFLIRSSKLFSTALAVATEQSLFIAQIQSSGALSTFDY